MAALARLHERTEKFRQRALAEPGQCPLAERRRAPPDRSRFARSPAGSAVDLSWLFTDIDDTLTTDGMLPDSSYRALWDLSRAGISVVPVTGRPAGWCDHIARMWPVAAVVGENGAFYYSYDRERRKMTRGVLRGPAGWAWPTARGCRRLPQRVLREVPGTALAADQPFRISDFAIDYCEDVPPLPAGKGRRDLPHPRGGRRAPSRSPAST